MAVYYYLTNTPQFYSYDLLSGIYQNIRNTFDQYQPMYRLGVKTESDASIQKDLEQIKVLEKKIADTYANNALKQKLQLASNGKIDPNRIPDAALPELLQKQSSLLGLTSTYNEKVKDLSDTLNQINSILIERGTPLSISINAPYGL